MTRIQRCVNANWGKLHPQYNFDEHPPLNAVAIMKEIKKHVDAAKYRTKLLHR
jgi:hypothetical protein